MVRTALLEALSDASVRTLLVSGPSGVGKSTACTRAFQELGCRVYSWDPATTGMRIPVLVSERMASDKRAVVVYADDVDVAMRHTKGGCVALLSALGDVEATLPRHARVVMTCASIGGDRALAALARNVHRHVIASPPTTASVLEILQGGGRRMRAGGTNEASAAARDGGGCKGEGGGEEAGRQEMRAAIANAFGSDIRGALLALDNLAIHGDALVRDAVEAMDDEDYVAFRKGEERAAPPSFLGHAAPVRAVRAQLDAVLMEHVGRDAFDGRLSSIAVDYAAAAVRVLLKSSP